MVEYPPKVELRKTQAKYPLPQPGGVDAAAIGGDGTNRAALSVLAALDAGLAVGDATVVGKCFFPDQAFWRDLLALTSHIRTFAGSASLVAMNLVETAKLRGLAVGLKLSGSAQFIPATPDLVSFYPMLTGGRQGKQLTGRWKI